ncbi:hypothetical protein Q1695_011345 [Nippostrongylus brasiliensis]|nr:hypothetical protein Q1695_011345 [Nippostrongylus brasiliensis]
MITSSIDAFASLSTDCFQFHQKGRRSICSTMGRSCKKHVRLRTSSRNSSSSDHPCQHSLTSFNDFIVGANIEPGERHDVVRSLDLFQLHDFSEQISNFSKHMEKNAFKENLKKGRNAKIGDDLHSQKQEQKRKKAKISHKC